MILSDIRKSAREALKGKWGTGILITLLFLAFEFVLGFINGFVEETSFLSFIISIIVMIITIPVSFGIIASFIKLKRGEPVKAYEIFTYGFKNFSRSWKIAGNVLLKLWLPILLYVLAIFALAFIISFGAVATLMAKSYTFIIIAAIFAFALLIASFVFLFIKSLYYSVVYMIAYDNPEMTGKEVIEESEKLMTGNKGKYVLLQLSFIGWAILSIFTLYIGLLWLIPYIQVSLVCFYEALKENKTSEE